MSDFKLEMVSEMSDEKVLKDKKFDAEQIYLDIKKELFVSGDSSALCSSDSSIDISEKDREVLGKSHNRNKSVEFTLHSYNSPIYFANKLSFNKSEKKKVISKA